MKKGREAATEKIFTILLKNKSMIWVKNGLKRNTVTYSNV
jgi:hypothetical protein